MNKQYTRQEVIDYYKKVFRGSDNFTCNVGVMNQMMLKHPDLYFQLQPKYRYKG